MTYLQVAHVLCSDDPSKLSPGDRTELGVNVDIAYPLNMLIPRPLLIGKRMEQ